jgi:hypothetical protein
MQQVQLRDASGPEQLSPIGQPTLQDGTPLELFWWVGGTPRDTVARLRVVAAFETGDPPALVALVDGTMVDGTQVLTLTRLQPPYDVEGPSLLPRRLALLRPPGLTGVDGIVRTVVVGDGVLKFQMLYSAAADAFDSPPRVAEVGVGWGNVVGRGATLQDALTALATRSGGTDATFSRWGEARRWFRRLDSARQSGDWNAFGRAYEELKRLLGEGREPAP